MARIQVNLGVYRCECGKTEYYLFYKFPEKIDCKCGKSLCRSENDYVSEDGKLFDIESGDFESLKAVLLKDNAKEQYLPDIDTLVERLKHIYGDGLERDPVSDRGRESREYSYYVRTCRKCTHTYWYAASTEGECKKCGGLINREDPADKGQGFKNRIDAMVFWNKIRKKEPVQSSLGTKVDEGVSPVIYFRARCYSNSDKDAAEFHEDVYRSWASEKIFSEATGELSFTKEYRDYLNSFADYSKYKKLTSKETLKKLLEDTSITDENQRFYAYLRGNDLIDKAAPLCWKIGEKVVQYSNVKDFVNCYATRDDYGLSRSQMETMINAQTRKYFFFDEQPRFSFRSSVNRGDDSEVNDLNFSSLVLEQTDRVLYKNLSYPSLQAFWDDMIVFDEKIKDKHEFVKAIFKNCSKVQKLHGAVKIGKTDYSVAKINDGRTDGDTKNLPIWDTQHENDLLRYLELCLFHMEVDSGKLTVFDTCLGDNCDNANKIAASIVAAAYEKRDKESQKRFAILRLCVLSDSITKINGVSHEMQRNAISCSSDTCSFLCYLKNACNDTQEGSFDLLLLKAYLGAINRSERNKASFWYENSNRSLKDHVQAFRREGDKLSRFWRSKERVLFTDYILFGNSGRLNEQEKEAKRNEIGQLFDKCFAIENECQKALNEIFAKSGQNKR